MSTFGPGWGATALPYGMSGVGIAPQMYATGGLAPQGLFGGALGGLLGGALGNTVGGWFGGSDIGQTIGSTLGGIGGGLLPFSAGPGVMPQSFFPQPISWISPTVGPAIPIWGGNMPPGMSGNVLPFSAGPALRPQGFFGDLLGQVGAPLGGLIGGALGNQGLGNTIGGWAGQLGSLLPFSAGPTLQPQGFFGDLLGQVGAPLGGWIGSQFGNQGLGNTIGGLAGQLGSLLPFSAGPALRPQGFFGDLLGQVGAPLGGWIGSQFGNQGLGNTIGGLAGQLGSLLPFSAGPTLMPQGFFGNLLGQVGAPLGGLIGGAFGNQGLGNTIGGLAGQLGSLLPFSAGPTLQPQGFFGDLLGQVGAPLGGMIGGALGNQGLGTTIGGWAGQLGSLLPFSAGPGMMQQRFIPPSLSDMQSLISQFPGLFAPTIGSTMSPGIVARPLPFSAGPTLMPQGFFGNLLGQVGAPLGGWIGSQFGNQGLGNTIGGLAGQLGSLLPFSTVPAAQPVWY